MSKDYLFQEIVVKNPVLIGTIGLCPVVAICTSLKAALIMSVITILTLIIAQALSSVLLRHLSQWLRMGLYTLVGMIVVLPSILLVEKVAPSTMLALGIYLPLLAVNPIVVRQCEREGINIGLAESFLNSLCAGLGYSAVLIFVGAIREILGNGTIWGKQVLPIVPSAAMLMPMGGFVVLSFMAALLRAYFKKIDPEYAEELAVNSRTAIKGHGGIKALLIDTEDSGISVPTEYSPMAEPKAAEDESIENPIVPQEETVPLPKEVKSEKSPKRSAKRKSKKSRAADERVAVPEEPPKPKYEFITLELPSAAEKSSDKPMLQETAPEAQTAAASIVNKGSENIDESLKEAEKAAKKKEAAKKRAQKAMDDARETAAKIREESIPAGPVSEEEAKTETSTARKSHDSKIVYRSEELERLMSMSLDDILNGLPTENDDDGEGGN